MLYSVEELNNISPEVDLEEFQKVLSRYNYKFENKRKEIKNLKEHEKYFFFFYISIFRNANDNTLAYNLYEIPEAKNFLFYRLILRYGFNLNFIPPVYDHLGELSIADISRDQTYFNAQYSEWIKELESKKGAYLSVLYNETYNKRRPIEIKMEQNQISKEQYEGHLKHLNVIAFFIYYKVKKFFDGQKEKYIVFKIKNYFFSINIYTYIHVLFRHYIPSLDFGEERSINNNIPIFDVENLPISLKKLITDYFSINTNLNNNNEYLLFSYDQEKYIIWIKYKKMNELKGNEGIEVRTLYKCTEKRDLDKFEDLIQHKIDNNLSFFF